MSFDFCSMSEINHEARHCIWYNVRKKNLTFARMISPISNDTFGKRVIENYIELMLVGIEDFVFNRIVRLRFQTRIQRPDINYSRKVRE